MNPKEDITQYPDDVRLSEEQERVLQMATGEKSADSDMLTIFAGEEGFDHLAPPKRSVGKVFLTVLLVIITAGGAGFGGWYFWWTRYATFDYELIPVVMLADSNLDPGDFLPSGEKDRGVTASFRDSSFTPLPGLMTVPLTLELGLRSLETNASLYVLTPVKELTHEFREEADDLDPKNLITNAQIAVSVRYELYFTERPSPLSEYEVGEHILKLTLNGTPFEVPLNVADTTPPSAIPQEVIINIGEEVSPDNFVTDIFDHSGISSFAFIGEYEGNQTFTALRNQIVEVELVDYYGNTVVYAGSLSVIANETAPEFIGVPGVIESMAGIPVSYPDDVIAVDDFGREITFVIDDSGVDTEIAGEYLVTYIAEDFTGLKTEIGVPLYIISIDPREVDDWIEESLERIIKTDMTQEEIVRAIFELVRDTVSYDKNAEDEWTGSLYSAAHYAISNSSGDFYHFHALSELLFKRADIINIRVGRIHSPSLPPEHIWSMIYYDPDGWYHYDSFKIINDAAADAVQHMFTQKQAEEIEKLMKSSPAFGKDGYYEYEKIYYPDIVPGED